MKVLRSFSLFIYTFSFLFICLFSFCKKAADQVEDYPIVEVLPVQNITKDGVTFEARVISNGTIQLIDCGFTWIPYADVPAFEVGPHARISFGNKVKAGEKISLSIDRDLYPNQKYHLRFYYKTDKGITYTNGQEFISKGAKIQPFSFVQNTLLSNDDIKATSFGVRIATSMSIGKKSYLATIKNELLTFEGSTQTWQKIYNFNPSDAVIGADSTNFFVIEYNNITGRYRLSTLSPINFQKQVLISQLPELFYGKLFYFNINDFIFICTENDPNKRQISFWKINKNTGTIIKLSQPPFITYFGLYRAPHIFDINGRILILQTLENFQNSFWEYNSNEDKWVKLNDSPNEMGKTSFWHTPKSNKFIYAGGGWRIPNAYSDVFTTGSFWKYDFTTHVWSHSGWLPTNGAAIFNFTLEGKTYWICNDVESSNPSFSFKIFSFDPTILND